MKDAGSTRGVLTLFRYQATSVGGFVRKTNVDPLPLTHPKSSALLNHELITYVL